MKTIKIALIGNPNCGKTTVFNYLTGLKQKVANYPGVTVEQKLGSKIIDGINLEIIDLPGIYSIKANSEDEKIARDYILDQKPDIVINIVDASNIEKSLFLTTQLMELGRPILLALNMMDIADARNLAINTKFLENILELESVELIANKKKGIDSLLKKAVHIAKKQKSTGINVRFDSQIENEIQKVEKLFLVDNHIKEKRLFAIKLLEEDSQIQKKLNNCLLLQEIKKSKDKLEGSYREHIEVVLSNQRHRFIRSILQKIVLRKDKYKKTFSDKLDEIFLHKIWGFPIFLLIMYLIFQFTFTVGAYPMAWIDNFFGFLSSGLASIWPNDLYPLLRSLIIDGEIAGVGAVLVFMPNIIILFFCISILEDSGYMARAAFILDRLMHKIGLHGKSFIPLLIGFGCSVPAIMATRFMESKKDRIITILALPLIACSAKLVVFTLLIPAFFTKTYQAIVLFSLYIVGIVLAISIIKLFKITMFRGQSFSFVMELPSYKMPAFLTILIHMWDRSKQYIKKAGTLILGFSILLWALGSFPTDKKGIADTYMGRIGKTMEPVFKPLGFDWKIGTSLIGSLAAKEVFISQIGIVYAIKDSKDTTQLQAALQKDYSPLQAYSLMLFILISTPCIATVAITRKETNSYKWAFFQFGYLTVLAYIVSMLVYQIGSIFTG